MNAPDWKLARRVEAILRRDIGRTDHALTDMLGTGYSELRQAAAVLYRSRRVDRNREHLVAVPSREGRRAA